MAEAVGLFASSITIATLVVQATNAANLLYNYLQDYKYARDDINNLSEELRSISMALSSIGEPPHQHDTGLRRAIQNCTNVITKLQNIVDKSQPVQGDSRRRAVARRLCIILNRDELAKHHRALEGAKSTLLQFCITTIRADQSRELETVQRIEKSVAGLTQEKISWSTTIQNNTTAMEANTKAMVAVEAVLTHIEQFAIGKDPLSRSWNDQKNTIRKAVRDTNSLADDWVKVSARTECSVSGDPSTSGQLLIQTRNVDFERSSYISSANDKKRDICITLRFIPPFKVPSDVPIKGFVVDWTNTRWSEPGLEPSPTFSLRYINIVEGGSHIMGAFYSLNFERIRALLSEGRASLYDVDPQGETLLAKLTSGLIHNRNWDRTNQPEEIIDEFIKLMTWLLARGLDPGEWDILTQTPLMLLCSKMSEYCDIFPYLWEKHRDKFEYIIGILLSKSRQSPFGEDVFVHVDQRGHYNVIHFPGAENEPSGNVRISPVALNYLIRQDEWPLSWSISQLLALCDLRHVHCSALSLVKFWVAQPDTKVAAALDSRLDLLKQLLQARAFAFTASIRHWQVSARRVVGSGGKVISLLNKDKHEEGSLPWICDASLKVDRVGIWMSDTLKLLQQFCPEPLISRSFPAQLLRAAKNCNTQTVSIVDRVLKDCGVDSTMPFHDKPIPPVGMDLEGENGDEALDVDMELGRESEDDMELGRESEDDMELGRESEDDMELGHESEDDMELGSESEDDMELGSESKDDFDDADAISQANCSRPELDPKTEYDDMVLRSTGEFKPYYETGGHDCEGDGEGDGKDDGKDDGEDDGEDNSRDDGGGNAVKVEELIQAVRGLHDVVSGMGRREVDGNKN